MKQKNGNLIYPVSLSSFDTDIARNGFEKNKEILLAVSILTN
jgi:hypothetical protein